MNFINKLIKKGAFSLFLVFCFFAFVNVTKVSAGSCSISLKDENKYLVLSQNSKWNDSGVSAQCSKVENEITVVVNDGSPILTTDSAEGSTNSYLTKPGFYRIVYSITSDPSYKVIRQVRVLPTKLNSVRNLWVGDNDVVNTVGNDYFTKVIEKNDGYLAVGDFNGVGYVVKFNLRGEYLWHWVSNTFSALSGLNVSITDLITSETRNTIFYIAGNYTEAGVIKAFIKPISITSNSTTETLDVDFGTVVTLDQMTSVNKLVIAGNYIFGAGYLTDSSNVNTAKIAKVLINSETGVLIDGATYDSLDVESQYSSIIKDRNGNLVVVGSTSVSGVAGATGGLIRVCDVDFSCETKSPYLYKDEDLNDTTITKFNNVIQNGSYYIVIGESRIRNVKGFVSESNSGVEDALIVTLDSNFSIKDVKLRGTTSSDSLLSVKVISDNKLIAVGKSASSGYYVIFSVDNGVLKLESTNSLYGNINVEVNDVLVKQGTDGELFYVFVGGTTSSYIENMYITSKENKNSYIIILDATEFDNYDNINIEKGASMCVDGTSTSCGGNQVQEQYLLVYGTKKIQFVANVDTSNEATINTRHEFINSLGVQFKIGRVIVVSPTPVPGDITLGETGIDKWYLYSRQQVVSDTTSSIERNTLWTDYYYPVDDGLDKGDETYYLFVNGEFIVDTTSAKTKNNYIKLAAESQKSNVAFQSIEKAQEYALLQEFARIALVKTRFNSETTGIIAFNNESIELSNINYYFVYYIDMSLNDKEECSMKNLVLTGNCTSYAGYAFPSLKRIKEVAISLLGQSNYFVSESNSRYDVNGSVVVPSTSDFKEEVSTIKYVQQLSLNINSKLYLDVEFYKVATTVNGEYVFSDVVTRYTTSVGKTNVTFSKNGDFKDEGKYVVKYCYNETTCGEPATFVIDRTAPKISYTLLDETTKTIEDKGWTASKPLKIKGDMSIFSVIDIDPYAYTIVDGKKYYLSCNSSVNSESCISNISEFVKRSFKYDKENPDAVYNITFYDRANNSIDVYFMVGTSMPTVQVDMDENDNSKFVLTINFYEKNPISEFKLTYTKSENCTACTDSSAIEDAIRAYVDAVIKRNDLESEKEEKDEEYTSTIKQNSITLDFVYSIVKEDLTFTGGVQIPKIDEDGNIVEGEMADALPVSKGLYEFALSDTFLNISKSVGGIGLEKAKLYVYENDDQWHTDDVNNFDDPNKNLIPKTEDNYSNPKEDDFFFLVREPDTYQPYIDLISNEQLKDEIDKSMYFTSKFIYVKFKVNSYETVKISRANSINGFANPYHDAVDHYSCLFTIYGDEVDTTRLDTCVKNIKFSELYTTENKDALKDLGIYIINTNYTENDEVYCYLAFANDGIYNVESKINISIDGLADLVALPIDKTFQIDTANPVVDTLVDTTSCKGEQLSFSDSDFLFTAADTSKKIVNIGNCDIQLSLESEKINYQDVDDISQTKINRLLLIKINGEVYNAYDYSLQNEWNGSHIIFSESGNYEIVFTDAAKNEIVYKFIIDKVAPSIDSITDENGKDLNTYQQYIDAKINISENSFIDKDGETILSVEYWVSSGSRVSVLVQSTDGECEVTVGTFDRTPICVVNNGINLEFVIAINKEERLSDSQKLYITVKDYFGNEATKEKELFFDNYNPYIYFNNSYTPIREFGENVSNEDREKMLSIDATSSLNTFGCNESETLIGGKVTCKDTPENASINNGVVIEAYEAYRVAYNNFIREINGTYRAISNGTYLSSSIDVYKGQFMAFISASNMQSKINSVDIYTKEIYVQVKTTDYIDPNVTYYYDNSGVKTEVSISDMYSNSTYYTSCSTSEEKCKLYNMYINSGKFGNNGYYYLDDNNYVKVDKSTITEADYSNYSDYYYIKNYVADTGKYLKALTLNNSCVSYNDSDCLTVAANRIKLIDSNVKYYNIIKLASNTDAYAYSTITINGVPEGKVIEDTRIWRIAIDNDGDEVNFGFNLSSITGRPIIFRAKDAAGNYSSSLLETVIVVKDNIPPIVKSASSIYYEADNTGGSTSNNYIKVNKYYKVENNNNISCDVVTTTYYKFNSVTSDYVEVDCNNLEDNTQYYALVEEYEKVEDNLSKTDGVIYYKKVSQLFDGENYLTSKNIELVFNEPIYKILCSYYDNNTGETYACAFNNTEFDYKENRMTFSFIDERSELYINYSVTVYDFAGNSTTIDYLFIDREKPVLEFVSASGLEDVIEVNYNVNNSNATKYTPDYINVGYANEVIATDSVDERIRTIGAFNKISNTLTYEVVFYSYNYNITYKNYILNHGVFTPVDDGLTKGSDTYYILIKKPTDYTLKDAECDDNYCYIKDEQNYYPALLNDDRYWVEIEDNTILKDKVGVYKVVYKVTDYSNNVSDSIARTIYVIDTTTPIIKVNGNVTEDYYGYHNNVKISFENENEAIYFEYKCNSSSKTCTLPTEHFALSGSDYTLTDRGLTTEVIYDKEGVYKIFFSDKGKYVKTTIKDKDGNELDVMTLKYNYREYLFIIDRTVPELTINAYEDEQGKIYYKASLNEEVYLYCVKGNVYDETLMFGNHNVKCEDYLSGTPQITTSSDNSVTYTLKNSNGEILTEKIYKKLDAIDNKYFYNTYYKKDGNEFIEYMIGSSYDNDNVYMITSIVVYFRDDGRYLVKAVDKAGNGAGRKHKGIIDEEHSSIDIDNTAPVYNKNNVLPTGINYWFSVPSKVVRENELAYVKNINNKQGTYYNIYNSGLNSSFFYAFASKSEAVNYLLGIYRNDIESISSSVCTGGTQGFEYTYYNPDTNSITTDCFRSSDGTDAKDVAYNKLAYIINNSLVYATYSEDIFFGDSTIKQKIYNEDNSTDMYKYLYLKVTTTQTSIVETCVSDGATKCIKVNAKIVKYDYSNNQNNTNIQLEIGGANTKDTTRVRVYSKALTGGTSHNDYSESIELKLNSDTYYIFEEVDKTIVYDDIQHFNTTYYAIIVDNNSKIKIYDEIDGTMNSEDRINGLDIRTISNNNDEYYLIVKNLDSDERFNKNYEIYELRDGSNNIIELYTYLRLKLKETGDSDYKYINLNSGIYLKLDPTTNEYYFKIPVKLECKSEFVFVDRAGNETKITISRSQVAPSIDLVYEGTGSDQTVQVTLRDSTFTSVKVETVTVEFSSDGVNYSSAYTTNILASLMCSVSGETNATRVYGCLENQGSINGKNTYAVKIANKENLYGFFRIYLKDSHGNENRISFIYNPADLTASFVTTANVEKYLNNSLAPDNPRIISKQQLKLEWNNEWNYLILYKLNGDIKEEVCNTKNILKSDFLCNGGGSTNNKVEAVVDPISNQYVKSTLYYDDEGVYEAILVNRESITIYEKCVFDGSVSEECKKIKSYTSNVCSWDLQPEYCAEALNILKSNASYYHSAENTTYYRFEIDRTAPSYDFNDFTVSTPAGEEIFRNNGIYTNAIVTVNWNEDIVRLAYVCSYEDGETCAGNFSSGWNEKKFTFGIVAQKTVTYTFYLEDYVSNKSDEITFTVKIILPEIDLYELENNVAKDVIVFENNDNKVTNKDIILKCAYEGRDVDCVNTFDVKLYKNSSLDTRKDITRIIEAEGFDSEYRYVVSIKSSLGIVYDDLAVSITFRVDKAAPTILVDGNKDESSGVYKGEVRVSIRNNDGVMTIYSGCVKDVVGLLDEQTYTCNESPMLENAEGEIILSKTNIYKIIAVDAVGNVTKGTQIKYVNIDNENPYLLVEANSDNLNYELPENAYTNVSKVSVTVKDNNDSSYLKYRIQTVNSEYGEWIIHDSNSIIITNEGLYEIIAVDIVGNESISRHFVIYRQEPAFEIYVGGKKNTTNDIITDETMITWKEPTDKAIAPIVSVTVNGSAYTKATVLNETGEYVFVFTDLAGNTKTHKLTINTSDMICLDTISIKPNKQYLFAYDGIKFSGDEGYTFKENDVMIFATAIKYYNGNSACGVNLLSYKSLDKNAYTLVSKNLANYINNNKDVEFTIRDEYVNTLKEQGGFVYVFIVDKDVAKNELGFEIGENFFTKDPIGWTLIMLTGVAFIYIFFKAFVLKKKVKVLK